MAFSILGMRLEIDNLAAGLAEKKEMKDNLECVLAETQCRIDDYSLDSLNLTMDLDLVRTRKGTCDDRMKAIQECVDVIKLQSDFSDGLYRTDVIVEQLYEEKSNIYADIERLYSQAICIQSTTPVEIERVYRQSAAEVKKHAVIRNSISELNEDLCSLQQTIAIVNSKLLSVQKQLTQLTDMETQQVCQIMSLLSQTSFC